MTEIRNLTALSPYDDTYLVPVQAADGTTRRVALNEIGGGGGLPNYEYVTGAPSTVVYTAGSGIKRYYMETFNNQRNLEIPASGVAGDEIHCFVSKPNYVLEINCPTSFYLDDVFVSYAITPASFQGSVHLFYLPDLDQWFTTLGDLTGVP